MRNLKRIQSVLWCLLWIIVVWGLLLIFMIAKFKWLYYLISKIPVDNFFFYHFDCQAFSNSMPSHPFNEKSFVTLSSVSASVWGTVHRLSECMSTMRSGIGLQYAWRWAHSIVLVLFSPWSPDNYPRFYRLTLLNRASLIFIECQLVLHCDVPTLGSDV